MGGIHVTLKQPLKMNRKYHYLSIDPILRFFVQLHFPLKSFKNIAGIRFHKPQHSFNINIDVLFHRLSIISFCFIRGWGCGEKIKFNSRVNKRGEGFVLGTGESLYTKYVEYLLKRTEQWFAFPCSFVQFQWKITGVCIY